MSYGSAFGTPLVRLGRKIAAAGQGADGIGYREWRRPDATFSSTHPLWVVGMMTLAGLTGRGRRGRGISVSVLSPPVWHTGSVTASENTNHKMTPWCENKERKDTSP